MRVIASVGVALWALGAVLVFLVPAGFWSDIPGGVLFTIGVAAELLATVVIVGRRLGRNR